MSTLGPLCSSWSAMARFNGSTRTAACPDGPRPLTRAHAQSLEQVERMVVVCALLHIRGGTFTIENPEHSLMFLSSPFVALRGLVSTWDACFDQCAYGLRPPAHASFEFIKKSTRFVANFPGISALEIRCPGRSSDHQHIHAFGARRALQDGKVRSVSVAISAGT